MAKFYVTTPIYYVNDVAHIGHAYTTIAADVAARWHRMKAEDVFLLTGTDEHGQKVEQAAKKNGREPKQFVDELAGEFVSLWEKLGLDYDKFIRTTDEEHVEIVKKFIFAVKDDIYKGVYEGYYCTPCETYFTPTQAPDKVCPDCGRELENLKEETYFFRMSKYEDMLMDFFEKNPDFVKPKSRMNEIMSRLRNQSLRDLSITRKTFSWGVPFPLDESHVTYVWFDALTNYISGVGFLSDEEKFEKWWPADYHLVGKDILWFHAVIWPCMLMAAGLPLPKHIFAHGWWTIEGEKMSKSKGNVVRPLDIVEKFGNDVFRYFLLREIPFGSDGDYSEKAIITRLNSDLADDLGNLVRRAGVMISKKTGNIPEPSELKDIDKEMLDKSKSTLEEADKLMDDLAYYKALEVIWGYINEVNKYMNDTAPWKEKDEERIRTVLYVTTYSIRHICAMIKPFLPDTAKKIEESFGFQLENFSVLDEDIELGREVEAPILFNKMDFPVESEKESSQLDLRVAKIVSVDEHPDADKLYVIKCDLGGEERQVVAGLKPFLTRDELLGKNAIIVYNLKPAKLRGVESQGMLLAAEHKDVVVLLTIDDAKPGDLVGEGSDKKISFEEFQNVNLNLKEGRLYHDDNLLLCNGEAVRVDMPDDSKIR